MGKIYILLKEFPSFSLECAVCNHGFFMMAPNTWDHVNNSFSRPLRLSDSTTSVDVTISQPPGCKLLLVLVHDVDQLCQPDKKAIEDQVSRMLRLTAKDEDAVQRFQQLHSKAKSVGFGRIFRAPSLFEDAVKCMLLCYTDWKSSLRMAEGLCNLQLAVSGSGKRRRGSGNFPSAQELAEVDLSGLGLGLRAETVQKFAKDVVSGRVNLSRFEACESQAELHEKLMKVKGFGDFAAATISMCIGFYQKVPLDTETLRHLEEVHKIRMSGVKRKREIRSKAIAASESVYDKYAPFQCLAFWFELWLDYNCKFGKLSELPSSSYCLVTGSKRARKLSFN